MPEITSVDGVARHSQIIRVPAPPSLLVDNTCRRAGTKQMGARGEAQGIRWYGGLHGQISARRKFRTSPRKMRGKFRTKLKYGIFPAEKSPSGIPPPPCSSPIDHATRTCHSSRPQHQPQPPQPHGLSAVLPTAVDALDGLLLAWCLRRNTNHFNIHRRVPNDGRRVP